MSLSIALIGIVLLLAFREHTQAKVTRALVDAIAAERTEFIATIQVLCQRIQAPEQAVFEHSMPEFAETPKAIPFDDDEALREATMTREQLAEMAMEAELAGSVSE